jgi:hypothetical protein
VILCWNVLEHLADPEAALARFARAIRPGELIGLAMPSLTSLKRSSHRIGLMWAFYRYVRRKPEAGKHDKGPLKTLLRFAIAPQTLERWGEQDGFKKHFIKS